MVRGRKSHQVRNRQADAAGMSVLDTYQKIVQLTRQMLAVARAHDWDELSSLGSARDSLLASVPARLPPMTVAENLKVQKAIEEILAAHAEITDHATPWLKHTATLLSALDHTTATTTEQTTDRLLPP